MRSRAFLALGASNHADPAVKAPTPEGTGEFMSESDRAESRSEGRFSAGPDEPGRTAAPGLPIHSGHGGRLYLAWPGRSAPRIFVPAGTGLARARIDLLSPQRSRGHALAWLVRRRLLGMRVRLEEVAVASLEQHLAEALGHPAVRFAINSGTPGAYRKATLQVFSPTGETLAFAKMADRPLSAVALATERRILEELAGLPGIGPHLPTPLAWLGWRGATILVLRPGPSALGPPRLGAPHHQFLAELHRATLAPARYRDSLWRQRMRRELARCLPHLDGAWRGRYDSALRGLEQELGSSRVPFCFAHRDFAPWNTRIGPTGLFVFDWEMGEPGTFPFHDAFCFEAAQAIAGLGRATVEGGFVGRLAAEVWPEGAGRIGLARLAFLVDASLYYMRASIVAPTEGRRDAITWFGGELDRALGERP